jgi:hypothetical protein
MAVIRERGVDRALFYDPDHDKLLSVTEGQIIAEAVVLERITATGVKIRDGKTVTSLALRDDQRETKP